LEKAEVDRRTDKEQMLAEILEKADADRKAYREDLKKKNKIWTSRIKVHS
jgi:hypothetical protein